MVAGWVVQLCWVVASDHRGHAAHPAPPEKPDATHQRRAPTAVDQASLAQRPGESRDEHRRRVRLSPSAHIYPAGCVAVLVNIDTTPDQLHTKAF
jgi:hypothetical protein